MRKLVTALAGILLIVNVGVAQKEEFQMPTDSMDIVELFWALQNDTNHESQFENLVLYVGNKHKISPKKTDRKSIELSYWGLTDKDTIDLRKHLLTFTNCYFANSLDSTNTDRFGSPENIFIPSSTWTNIKASFIFIENCYVESNTSNELKAYDSYKLPFTLESCEIEGLIFRELERPKNTTVNVLNSTVQMADFMHINVECSHSEIGRLDIQKSKSIEIQQSNSPQQPKPKYAQLYRTSDSCFDSHFYFLPHKYSDINIPDSIIFPYNWNIHADEANFTLKNCNFSNSQQTNVAINGTFRNLEIIHNVFNNINVLDLSKSQIVERFSLSNCTGLNSVNLSSTLFSEFYNKISWEAIKNSKLCVLEELEQRIPIITNSSGVVYKSEDPRIQSIFGLLSMKRKRLYQNIDTYDRLKASYSKIYQIYKEQANTASANACYAEMKVLETRWWKQQYKEQPSFENYFRWKLNEFLNFFTDYGTNPAKAVVKSIWVILIFSVFYLFFPSDWDVSNRSELLKRGKELFSKNRSRGILANLWFLLYTGFIHALNAITLSMNAFTTLGFGDILTRGAARYVTIVQGLIGWFLLTIFSVSLINQVLG